jgi:nitrous oxidase accessory protein
MHFMFSNDCTYEQNTFSHNSAGVAVMFTRRVEMNNNRFENNWGTGSYGILLKEIYESRIRNNRFVNNSVGMYCEGSNKIVIEHNLFEKNGWAVRLMANSMDNTFSKNNFVANTFEIATNSSRNYNTFSGNYWSRYKGYDLNRDGIGDVPHHPVTLFSALIEKNPTALLLLHSFLIDILDASEKVFPSLTPEALTDNTPRMRLVN